MKIDLTPDEIIICVDALHHAARKYVKTARRVHLDESPIDAVGWHFYQAGIVHTIEKRLTDYLAIENVFPDGSGELEKYEFFDDWREFSEAFS